MMKKFFILLILLFIPIFCFAETNEEILPKLKVKSFKIASDNGNSATGSFTVMNKSDFYASGLSYVLSLSSVEVKNQVRSYVTVKEYSPVEFQVAASGETTLNFKCDFPGSLPDKEYVLKLDFFSKTMPISTYLPSTVAVKPKATLNGFLSATNPAGSHCWVIDGKNILPMTGPTFLLGQTPVGKIELTSEFSSDITARPKFTVYDRLQTYSNKPVATTYGQNVTFKPGESKEVTIEFPEFNNPESYLIKVTFVNSANVAISNEYSFRYVLAGTSAKILSTNATYSVADQKINIDMVVIGPADGTDIKNAKVVYKVYDNAINYCLKEETREVDLTSESSKITAQLPVMSANSVYRVEVQIMYLNKVLSESQAVIEVKNAISQTKVEENKEKFSDVIDPNQKSAVIRLVDAGIVSGYPDGTFKPLSNVTRAEFAVIAVRLGKFSENTNGSSAFSDVGMSHWAKDFINLAYEKGLLKGYGNNEFKPNNNVTYAESLTILLNLLGYKQEMDSSSLGWPNNYIQKAQSIGLTKNIEISDFSSPAPRGDIAELALAAYLKVN